MIVLVAANKYAPAFAGEPLRGKSGTHWFSEGRAIPLLEAMPLVDALKRRAPAHVMMYAPDDAPLFPRLRKSASIYYAANPKGAPRLRALVVDVDYTDHSEPPSSWHEDLLAKITGPFADPAWYRTPHGLRLCYALPGDGVELPLAQSFVTQAFDAIRAMGVPADPAAQDWTRLNKLPLHNGELPMSIDSVPVLHWAPAELTQERPTVLGTITQTEAPAPESMPKKVTRQELKPLDRADSRLANQIYSGTFAAPTGERHAALLRAAITISCAYRTNDPTIAYGYLAPSATSMGKDLEELWSLCCWAAALFDGWQTQVTQEREALLFRAAAEMGCSPGDVPQRLIVDTGPEQFVWDENAGAYSAGYCKQHQLLGAIDRHCPTLVGDYYTTFTEAVRLHSVPAQKLVYTYDASLAGYDEGTQTMYVPVAQLDTTLQPTYDAEVEEWLQGVFGASAHGERFLDWLACFYRTDRPVCAVYLQGPPGVGKNLLVAGLARAYGRESPVVEFRTLIESFNGSLLDTPVVFADEALPKNHRGSAESTVLRQFVGNTGFRVNQKFRTEATIQGYPRVILAANNSDLLAFREDMSPHDVDAIRVRVAHLVIDEDAAEGFLAALAERRGHASIRAMTDRWVRDGALAAHVRWMQAHRPVREDTRFLVEGWESDMTQNLPANVGAAGVLVAMMVAAITSGQRFASIRWFGGSVYVSNPLLPRDWEALMQFERMPSDASRVRALRGLSGGNTRILSLDDVGRRRQKMYWEIPGEMVARIATDRGEVDPDVLLAQIQSEEKSEKVVDLLSGTL